jgi:hypothetical protein
MSTVVLTLPDRFPVVHPCTCGNGYCHAHGYIRFSHREVPMPDEQTEPGKTTRYELVITASGEVGQGTATEGEPS